MAALLIKTIKRPTAVKLDSLGQICYIR